MPAMAKQLNHFFQWRIIRRGCFLGERLSDFADQYARSAVGLQIHILDENISGNVASVLAVKMAVNAGTG